MSLKIDNSLSISVIIPTLNAERYLKPLLDKLQNQTLPPTEIVVVDSSSDDATVEICKEYEDVRVIEIQRCDFDHGRTRDIALRTCKSEHILFITQDAIPYDEYYIEKLLEPFNDKEVAISYGRQIAHNHATRVEKLVREYNYPSQSHIRSKKDFPSLGIKTYFFSDVCSAYRRDIYELVGGFEYPIKTNEDMFYAAKVIKSNYKVAYVAEAVIIHSHNLNLKEQYNRNYILGMELERHKELINGVSPMNEGLKMVGSISIKLLRGAHFISFIHFGFDCCARALGSHIGRKSISRP